MDHIEKSKWIYFLPAIFWSILILILSAANPASLPKLDWVDLISPDKAGHLFFYGLLAWLVMYGFSKIRSKLSMILTLLIISFVSLYGFTIEILQYSFFEGRHFDYLDLIANIIGSNVGASAFKIFKN